MIDLCEKCGAELSEDANYCSTCGASVKEMKEKKDVKGLIKALKSGDEDERYCAAKELSEIGDTRAIKPLIETLYDEDLMIHGAAIMGLLKIGKPAVEPLIEALETLNKCNGNVWIRRGLVSALGKIGDARATESIIEALKDSDWMMREDAALALGDIGDKRAVKPLISSLKDAKEMVVRENGRWEKQKAQSFRERAQWALDKIQKNKEK